MENWKARIHEEVVQLDDRINKLTEFMQGDKFSELPEQDKELMAEQKIHMVQYLRVLHKRCVTLGIDYIK